MTDKAAPVRSWRGRLPVVAVVVACVAGVVAAVSGAANPVSAVQFLLPGHWIYNSSLQTVFHVDGSTGDVDARGRVPGGSGDQVFQGDTSGYVVGESRITEFGKSSLSVEKSATPPSREKPVGVETAGGPYLVYQQAGKVVRLGEPSTVLSLGGPVGMPVATRDGTLWLPRTNAGLLCQLPAKAKSVSCPVLLPKGHAGGLSVVDDRVVFVDTTEDTQQVVEKDGLGEARDLGVDAHGDARLASTDVDGRLAILDGQQMHLVDTGDAAPVTVDLDEGEYAGPVSTGSVVAVVNRTTSTLVTYDSHGTRKQTKALPAEKGDPRLIRGEDDRIYVDGAEGQHVVVVDTNGDLTDVPITEKDPEPAKPSPGKDPDEEIAAPKPDPTQPSTEQPAPQTPLPPTATPAPNPKPDAKPDPTPTPGPKPDPTPTPDPKPDPTPVVPPSPPGASTGVNATAGDASATVNWGPAQANRSPITAYRITWPGGQTTTTANTATITGLANGTTYVFTVTALSAAGAGPGAASNPVTPVAPVRPPSAPTNLVVNYDNNNHTAAMTWTQPADLGGGTLSHYVVSVTDHPDITVTGQAAVVDNITATGTITFSVTAVATASGQQFTGAPATTTREAPVDNGTIALSRGPETQDICAGDPDCAWMHIVLTGMRPNTSYTLTPHSTNPGYIGGSASITTDGGGNAATDKFAYHEEGYTVWVTATPAGGGTEIRSNDLVWQKAG
jgi:hypothetical protein